MYKFCFCHRQSVSITDSWCQFQKIFFFQRQSVYVSSTLLDNSWHGFYLFTHDFYQNLSLRLSLFNTSVPTVPTYPCQKGGNGRAAFCGEGAGRLRMRSGEEAKRESRVSRELTGSGKECRDEKAGMGGRGSQRDPTGAGPIL